MAFGFPASYTEVIHTTGTRRNARASVTGVFEALAWRSENVLPDLYKVRMSLSALSWGETLTVQVTGLGTVIVTSKCHFFWLFDWGRNKQNVKEFAARFSAREIRETLLARNEPTYLDHQGRSPVERLISTDEPVND